MDYTDTVFQNYFSCRIYRRFLLLYEDASDSNLIYQVKNKMCKFFNENLDFIDHNNGLNAE